MATVQSVGGAPGIAGLTDLLDSGILMAQKNKQDKQDREDKQTDFKLKEQQLAQDKENAKIMRQAQLRQSLMENAGRIGQEAYDRAIKNGLPEADAMKLKDFANQQYVRSVIGTDPDQAEETYGTPMKDYMLANQKDTSTNKNFNPTQTYTPQMFMKNAGALSSIIGMGQGQAGPPVGQGLPSGMPGRGNPVGWTMQNQPFQSTGRGQAPLSPDAQNMQALMSMLAMRGNQPPMMNPQGVAPTQQQLETPGQ